MNYSEYLNRYHPFLHPVDARRLKEANKKKVENRKKQKARTKARKNHK